MTSMIPVYGGEIFALFHPDSRKLEIPRQQLQAIPGISVK